MASGLRDGFAARYRWAVVLFGSLAAIALLVLAYRLTAPGADERTTDRGERVPEGDVLRVGALPVT
ncbi:MAG TPA: hypothetical protein VFB46_14890 [Gemmatimonadaceae bacterium]|nr:hypothetical protein [Gemmatimonadaceae bacterium]